MNGHVFECFGEQGNRRQFQRSLEALEEYAKKHEKFAKDLVPLFAATIKNPAVDLPEDLPTSPAPSKTEEMIWTEEVKTYVKRSQALRGNLATLYAITWGQCSEAMKAKVRSHE